MQFLSSIKSWVDCNKKKKKFWAIVKADIHSDFPKCMMLPHCATVIHIVDRDKTSGRENGQTSCRTITSLSV